MFSVINNLVMRGKKIYVVVCPFFTYANEFTWVNSDVMSRLKKLWKNPSKNPSSKKNIDVLPIFHFDWHWIQKTKSLTINIQKVWEEKIQSKHVCYNHFCSPAKDTTNCQQTTITTSTKLRITWLLDSHEIPPLRFCLQLLASCVCL